MDSVVDVSDLIVEEIENGEDIHTCMDAIIRNMDNKIVHRVVILMACDLPRIRMSDYNPVTGEKVWGHTRAFVDMASATKVFCEAVDVMQARLISA